MTSHDWRSALEQAGFPVFAAIAERHLTDRTGASPWTRWYEDARRLLDPDSPAINRRERERRARVLRAYEAANAFLEDLARELASTTRPFPLA